MSALVVEVDHGDALLWVEGGRLWLAYRLSRGSGFSSWVEVNDAPGIGGVVLSDTERARLVAPVDSHTARASVRLSRTDYEREKEAKERRDDAWLERRRMGDDS